MAAIDTAGAPDASRLTGASRLAPERPGGIRRALGSLVTGWHRLRGHHRYDDFRLEHVEQMPLVVMPTVFNPRLLRTGAFLAAQIMAQLHEDQMDVLDMGTGSGVGALVAARSGRRVVAVDLNPAAVRCATVNALMNGLDDRIEVQQGDLFAPVGPKRFDLVLFNPPFFLGNPASERDRAWRSTGIADRFAAGLGTHLKPGGSALVVLSSFGHATDFIDALARYGFQQSIVAEREFLNERIRVLRIEPAGAHRATPP